MPDVAVKDLCIDTAVPDVVARFWATMLGLEVRRREDGVHQLAWPVKERTIWVNAVPEPLSVKNRVHVDVRRSEPPAAMVIRADEHWTVMVDPDGLQFCAFDPRANEPFGVFELVVDAADPLAIAAWWAARTGAAVHIEDTGWGCGSTASSALPTTTGYSAPCLSRRPSRTACTGT